jgi:hypothetical protein
MPYRKTHLPTKRSKEMIKTLPPKQFVVRVCWENGKTQYVGYRINKGICLTDVKAAYKIEEREAKDIAEELKKSKEYKPDLCTISVEPYYPQKP